MSILKRRVPVCQLFFVSRGKLVKGEREEGVSARHYLTSITAPGSLLVSVHIDSANVAGGAGAHERVPGGHGHVV
jgi:hypothetical protein